MRYVICLALVLMICGCEQSAPPMPKAFFDATVARCNLKSTIYTARDGIFIDEPLIDFSREKDPAQAHRCVNQALRKLDSEHLERTGAEHLSYIWEWTE